MSKEPEIPHFLLTIERKYHILPLKFVAAEIWVLLQNGKRDLIDVHKSLIKRNPFCIVLGIVILVLWPSDTLSYIIYISRLYKLVAHGQVYLPLGIFCLACIVYKHSVLQKLRCLLKIQELSHKNPYFQHFLKIGWCNHRSKVRDSTHLRSHILQPAGYTDYLIHLLAVGKCQHL